ncbi:kumamolisin [Sulfobacillus thermosulfidooxidans DSM 9293]|uniref:Kumamolisin n=2 Tax=Sulfobacillus thermosulfidooxidans TaxID=28034 RepID=A0A1W1WEA6_SULTA|nr:S53 family peptidase [Sulfobacillus thermosulfidooxidans]ABQ85696.1 kumamolysin-As precursor-like protein [Sulfobacillus thermosulfidooxidans]SMC04380.1 kumamolisin [Sulfobacillus thermosulfidooxidans DSM 9293]
MQAKLVRATGHLLPEETLQDYHRISYKERTTQWACVFKSRHETDLKRRLAYDSSVLTREEVLQLYGPDPDLIDRARQWLSRHGVRVLKQDGFILWLQGSLGQIEETLKIPFGEKDGQFMPLREPLVPEWLAPHIVGFVGLENVSKLYPRFRFPTHPEELANNGQGFFPLDIQTAYAFPASLNGSGLTIGLLEFSNGFNPQDVMTFWNQFGIACPNVSFVSVDGTPNDLGVNAYDLEATLDIEWAGAMAPLANLVVYEANAGSSDTSFALSVLKALQYAYNDVLNCPDILSISYGDGETRFPVSTMQAWDMVARNAALIGMTIFVASGDQGAYGLHGPGRKICHVDAPANSPHMVSVGGTHLLLNSQGQIVEETGWTDVNNNGASGGGISQVFAVPAYQEGIPLPVKAGYHVGRGVPDVALNADPDTGYAVFFQGMWTVVGGTSVASPIWAAITALINQNRVQAGKSLIGYMNPRLYGIDHASTFHDITVGNNSYDGVTGYDCTPGWDAVTGWGSPIVVSLVKSLS